MICIIALIVFSIMGLFSATHRALAKEALDCVLRRVTLRPCNTGFNEKIKGKIIGKLLTRSVTAAKIFNKHFEILSWIFIVTTLISLFFVVKGAYNFYLYGSCNGLNKSGFCVFDPTGENNKISQISTQCSAEEPSEKILNLSGVNLDSFPVKNATAKDKIVFIGCYECDYTRKTYPIIQKLIEKNDVSFTFAHIPIKSEMSILSKFSYCAYKQDQEKFWQLNEKVFSSNKKDVENLDYVISLANEQGYNAETLKTCINDPNTQKIVDQQLVELQKAHTYGTPTIFINGEVFVGSKPYRVYERALKGWKFW